MEINVNKIENVAVLAITGRIDKANVVKLENSCRKLLEKKEYQVLLDGTHLEFISSAGLRVLLKLAKEVKKNMGQMAVAHVSDLVHEIFKISGFSDLFPMYENVVTALAHFQKPNK